MRYKTKLKILKMLGFRMPKKIMIAKSSTKEHFLMYLKEVDGTYSHKNDTICFRQSNPDFAVMLHEFIHSQLKIRNRFWAEFFAYGFSNIFEMKILLKNLWLFGYFAYIHGLFAGVSVALFFYWGCLAVPLYMKFCVRKRGVVTWL